MTGAMGVDVGSVAVKVAILRPDGTLVSVRDRPIHGRPADALLALLAEVPAPALSALRVGVTGNGRDLVHGRVHEENETVALCRSLPVIAPHARSVIEIGGHASRFVQIDPATHALLDYGLNQQCAAGSGSFFEQQAGRLGFTVEEMARSAASAARGATVAGRCSVFAKSDMIHLQQKGTPVEEIAYGLCLAMARNFQATVLRGREAPGPLLLCGGGARNGGLLRAFGEVLGLPDGAPRASPHAGCEGAIGAALAALDDPSAPAVPWAEVVSLLALSDADPRATSLRPLAMDATPPAPFAPADGPLEAFLGVDVGSVSTNLVLLGMAGEVHEGIYLPTRGRPIEAVGAGLDRIRDRFGHRLRVVGVAVTGSGRHLAARMLGADLVKNEITCQLRGAIAVDPHVDTLFEIGGQDSKYVFIRDRHMADFVMNKICAAGTGSFLEEQAEHLGVAIVDEFSRLAATASAPADLGCQCTVFMHSEVVTSQRRGTSTPDLCAGLAYSVARNYLDRVVAGRPVGRRVMFQGGVANNPAVVAAFRQILGVLVTVHPYAGVSGAIGAAHLVREARPATTAFRGLDACRDHRVRSFECKVCANRCQVNQILIEAHKVYFGDACERYASRVADRPESEVPDLIATWAEIERPYLAPPPRPRGRIGMPRASTLVDQLPFWTRFFASLGREVVLSEPSSQATLQAGLRRLPAETCLPIKLTFGHVAELADSGVDHVFLPSILNRPGDDPRMSHSCPYVQAVPYMVRAAMKARFLSPEVDMSGGEETFLDGMAPSLEALGVQRADVARAYRDASAAWADCRRQLVEAGAAVLSLADRALVIIGKPYNVLDPYLNLNIFQHLRRLGVLALPMWCLPIEDAPLDPRSARLPWHFNRAILRAVHVCGRDDRLFPVVISNFGCGPDAFTQKHLEHLLGDRPALLLEFDEHRAEAGLVTRLEAFLDEIDEPARPSEAPCAAALRPGLEVMAPSTPAARRSFVVPYFSDHAYVFSGALRAAGHASRVLPLPTPEIQKLGAANSSGKECHPYNLLTADLVNLARSRRKGGETFFFPGTSIPCLLHQYGDGHRLLLKKMGVADLSVMTPSFADMRELFGLEIGARMWRGLVAVDLLIKMVCETRPYEQEPGMTDEIHRQNLRDVEIAIATDELSAALTMATSRLRLVPVDRSVPRPVVGVAGDIFTRINPVGNEDLFAWLEARGCEVWPAPFLVDITDFSMRRNWSKGSWGESALLGALILRKDYESWRVKRLFSGMLKRGEEPGFQEVVDMASPYLGRQQNEVLVLNVAKMVDFARRGADGILNAVCFNCMLGTVSASITGRLREDHGGIPVASLVYSSVPDSQRAVLEAFLHQVQAFARRRSTSADGGREPARERNLLSYLWPSG